MGPDTCKPLPPSTFPPLLTASCPGQCRAPQRQAFMMVRGERPKPDAAQVLPPLHDDRCKRYAICLPGGGHTEIRAAARQRASVYQAASGRAMRQAVAPGPVIRTREQAGVPRHGPGYSTTRVWLKLDLSVPPRLRSCRAAPWHARLQPSQVCAEAELIQPFRLPPTRRNPSTLAGSESGSFSGLPRPAGFRPAQPKPNSGGADFSTAHGLAAAARDPHTGLDPLA